MNTETGEIIENPTSQQVVQGNLLQISGAERELLETYIDPAHRNTVLQCWREFKKENDLQGAVTRSKAMNAFFVGAGFALELTK